VAGGGSRDGPSQSPSDNRLYGCPLHETVSGAAGVICLQRRRSGTLPLVTSPWNVTASVEYDFGQSGIAVIRAGPEPGSVRARCALYRGGCTKSPAGGLPRSPHRRETRREPGSARGITGDAGLSESYSTDAVTFQGDVTSGSVPRASPLETITPAAR